MNFKRLIRKPNINVAEVYRTQELAEMLGKTRNPRLIDQSNLSLKECQVISFKEGKSDKEISEAINRNE